MPEKVSDLSDEIFKANLTVFCHLVKPYEYVFNQTMMHLFTCFTETMRSDISSADKLEYSGSIRLGATSTTDPRLQS